MPPVLAWAFAPSSMHGSPVGDLEIDIAPSVGLNLYRMTLDAASNRNEGSNQQTLGFGNVSNNGNEPTQTGIYLKKNAAWSHDRHDLNLVAKHDWTLFETGSDTWTARTIFGMRCTSNTTTLAGVPDANRYSYGDTLHKLIPKTSSFKAFVLGITSVIVIATMIIFATDSRRWELQSNLYIPIQMRQCGSSMLSQTWFSLPEAKKKLVNTVLWASETQKTSVFTVLLAPRVS